MNFRPKHLGGWSLGRIFIKSFCLIGLIMVPLTGNSDLIKSENLQSSMSAMYSRSDLEAKDIPIPWGMEIPFPWTFVTGDWVSIYQNQVLSLYRFQVVRDQSPARRQLYIQKLNPKTCEIIADGVGEEKNNVVYAQLSSQQKTEWITVRSFDEKQYPVRPLFGKNVAGNVLILSTFDLEGGLSKKADFILGNVNDGTAQRPLTKECK